MDPQQNTPPLVAEPKNNHKFIWVLVSVLILLLVSAFCVWYFQMREHNEVSNIQNEIVDETANWKTYRNDEYGFEFSHPFKNVETMYGRIFFDYDAVKFTSSLVIEASDSFIDLKEWYLNDGYGVDLGNSFEEMIEKYFPDNANVRNVSDSSWICGGSIQHESISCVFLSSKKEIFLFTFTAKLENKKIDQILSTFKFIENSDSIVFQKIGGDHYGALTLTGYLSFKDGVCDPENGGDCSEYTEYTSANFNILESDNDLIFEFLNEWSGNSYVGSNSVRLGCYDKGNEIIHSSNMGELDSVENKITGKDLSLLLSSSKINPVKLKLNRPLPPPGGGAPSCYSLFRNFKVLE